MLLLLQESLDVENRQLVQLPDVVAFLLHYHEEAEAFCTAYAMTDSPEKYFIVPDSEVFDRLIKSLLPKIWSRTYPSSSPTLLPPLAKVYAER